MTPSVDTPSMRWRTATQVLLLVGIATFYYFFLYRTPVTLISPSKNNVDKITMTTFTASEEAGVTKSGAVSLGELHGRVVFLHFWASWCSSCRAEVDTLKLLRERFDTKRMRMIGLATQDQRSDVSDFLKSVHFPLEVYLDPDGGAAQFLSIRSIPQSVIIDQNGFLRLRIEGALRESHFDTIGKLLDELGV